MKIKGKDIRKLVDLLISDEDVFEVDIDYYWEINHDEAYDPVTTPEKPGLGQLSFDWDDLNNLLNDDEDCRTTFHISTLGKVLRVIGDNIHPAHTFPE